MLTWSLGSPSGELFIVSRKILLFSSSVAFQLQELGYTLGSLWWETALLFEEAPGFSASTEGIVHHVYLQNWKCMYPASLGSDHFSS